MKGNSRKRQTPTSPQPLPLHNFRMNPYDLFTKCTHYVRHCQGEGKGNQVKEFPSLHPKSTKIVESGLSLLPV